jgi:hypothetical protein
MIGVDTPDCNSPHPRPLMLSHTGKPVSYSVLTITAPYLDVSGYFEPHHVDFSVCTSAYLSYGNNRGLGGIFAQSGEGREGVRMGSGVKARSVKLYGLRSLGIPGVTLRFFG